MMDFFTAVLARTEDRRPELTRRPMSAFETPRWPQPRNRLTAGPAWTSPQDGGLEETTVREERQLRPATPVEVPPPVRTRPSSLEDPDDRLLVPEQSRRTQPQLSRLDGEEAPTDVRPQRTALASSVGMAATPRPDLLDPLPEFGITTQQAAIARTARRGTPEPAEQPALTTRRVEPVPAAAPVVAARAEAVPTVTPQRTEAVPAEPPRPVRRIVPAARPEEIESRLLQEPPVQPLRRQRSAAGRAPGIDPAVSPATPPPVVHVTIGRIEVRATPARSIPSTPTPRPAAPKLSLDEYLRSRNGRAV